MCCTALVAQQARAQLVEVQCRLVTDGVALGVKCSQKVSGSDIHGLSHCGLVRSMLQLSAT